MSGLVESAISIMSVSERRLNVIAQNVSNISTVGFKRQLTFSELSPENAALHSAMRIRPDLAQGRLGETGNPLDLAIASDGFFALRSGESIVYSRQGQFRLAADGRVETSRGEVLQQSGGGDLILDHADVEILADGTVLDAGRPVGRIALFQPGGEASVEALGGSTFAIAADAVEEMPEPELRQGFVEASNVSLGDEMVAMMTAVRQAEGGARLVQVYDELLGRAITSFGQSGR